MAVDDAYTKALLHFNGSDASTTFTDESGKTWTANGDAQLDTAQKVFGTASGLFDGTDYISTPNSSDVDFGTGDFTIDYRIMYASSLPEDYETRVVSIGQWASGVFVARKSIYLNGTSFNPSTYPSAIDTWYHVAICRASGTLYYFLNGTKYLETAATQDIQVSGESWIGRANDGYHNGWIDEFRVSKGIARWTANFTPPTKEYSDPNVEVTTTTAVLTITPNAVTISYDLDITSTTDIFTITSNQVGVSYGVGVSANVSTLTITPNAADVISNVDLEASTKALTIIAQQANVSLDVLVSASLATLTITSISSDIEAGVVNVWGTTAALTLAEHASAISYDIPISATTDTFTIAPYDAAIWAGAEWDAWISANIDKITYLYYCILTGTEDGETDLTIPMKSWQARRKTAQPTFLSVVTPYSAARQAAIEARTSGTIQVSVSYLLAGVEQYQEIVCQVDYEDMRVDRGGRSQSITIEGHITESFTPKTMALRNVISETDDDGDLRYQCATVDMYLNPGDTATYGANSFTVAQIVYFVSPTGQSMNVNQAEI